MRSNAPRAAATEVPGRIIVIAGATCQAYPPQVAYTGDLYETAALEAWILSRFD